MKYKYSFSDFAFNPLPYDFKLFEIGDFKVPFYVPTPIDNLSSYFKNGVIPCVFLNTFVDGIAHPSLSLLTYSYILPTTEVGSNVPVCLYLAKKNDTLFAVNLWDISFSYSVNQGLSRHSYSYYSYGVAFYPHIGQFCVYSDISDNYVIYGSFGSLFDAMEFASDFYISSIDVIRIQICYVIGAIEHPHINGNSNILAPAPYVYFVSGDFCPIVPLSCCPLDYSPIIQLLGGQ